MKFSGLAVLALALTSVHSAYADPVHLETGGSLLGPTPLSVGQEITFGFSLANPTQVTSLQFAIHPVLGGLYSITITGPGGTQVAQPGLFAAGTYEVAFDGTACGGPCVDAVANLDYYRPAVYTDIGGAVIPGLGVGDGIGWSLIGESVASPVPEPGTAALVGSGVLGLLATGFRRFRHAA